MVNPLFVGFVANVIQQQKGDTLEEFRELLLSRLQSLYVVEELEELEWYSDLFEYWMAELSEADIVELLPEFVTIVSTITPPELCSIGVDIRNSILLGHQPRLKYPIETFNVIFSVRWADGTVGDCCCRPFVENDAILFDPDLMRGLSEMFQQHFVDFMCKPGLDGMHDQSAKTFSYAKFEELLGVLHSYVNALSADEREAYQHIIKRISHVFGNVPKIKLKKNNPEKLQWLENGGGFCK